MVLEFLKSLGILEIFFDAVIVIIALVIRSNLGKAGKKMQDISEQVDKAYKDTTGNYKKNSRGNLERTTTEEIERDDHEPLRAKFNAQYVEYNAHANMISVLPLLGLLGTVMGLIPGLMWVKSGDFDHLYSSLSTALTSTWVGLVTSIWLKSYVSLKIGKVVNKVEIGFAEIDRLYEIQ
jgi:biopolymer transport protein ExbB/TolQ